MAWMDKIVKNHLWPAIMGLGGAVLTAVATGLPQALSDGFQHPDDTLAVGGTAAVAALTFLATIMNRYAGKFENWNQPPKQP